MGLLLDANDGPAPEGSPLRVALDLLIVRGCTVTYTPPSDDTLEVYVCRYRAGPVDRARMFYADHRGAKQAQGLLQELMDDDRFAAVGAAYTAALARSFAETYRQNGPPIFEKIFKEGAT